MEEESRLRKIDIERGRVLGSLYIFAKDEGLPEHDHVEGAAHMMFVMSGSVEIGGPRIQVRVVKSGGVYDFEANSPHYIRALEDETTIWNPIK